MLLNWLKGGIRSVRSHKASWAVLILWVIALALIQTYVPQNTSKQDNMQSQFNASLPSREAEQILHTYFDVNTKIPVMLVWHRANGFSNGDYSLFKQLSQSLASDPVANQLFIPSYHNLPVDSLSSELRSNGTVFLEYLYLKDKLHPADIKIALQQLEDRINETAKPEKPLKTAVNNEEKLAVRISGTAPLLVEESERTSPDILLFLAVASFIIVIQLLIYRSFVWAFAPIAAAAAAYFAASPVLAEMFAAGSITYQTRISAPLLLLLAVTGIDHLSFAAAGLRHQLKAHRQEGIPAVIGKTLRLPSFILALIGFIVTVVTTMLLLIQYGPLDNFYTTAHAAALAAALAASLLPPALKRVLGFVHPAAAQASSEEKPAFTKTWRAFVHMALVIALGAGVALQIKYTFDTLSAYSSNFPSPSREGMMLVERDSYMGLLAPVHVLVREPMNPSKARQLYAVLNSLDFVHRVRNPIQSELDQNFYRYEVYLKGNPVSWTAMERLPIITRVVNKFLNPDMDSELLNNPNSNIRVFGITAAQYERDQASKRAGIIMMPVILVVFILMLPLFFRAIRNFVGYR